MIFKLLPSGWAARGLASLALASCLANPRGARAAEAAFDLELKAGDLDRRHSPVSVILELPPELAGAGAAELDLVDAAGKRHAAQLTGPSLLTMPAALTPAASPLAKSQSAGGQTARQLNFIVDAMPRGTTERWTLTISIPAASPASDSTSPDSAAKGPRFRWRDTPGDHADLLFGDGQNDRPVLRYMDHPLDESSKASREATYKVFHHVFDPSGVTLLTKGIGGEYTHHRGLFFGFNKVSYDGGAKTADVWHCTGDAHQSHDDFLASEAGPVLGRHRVKIGWHGPGKETFAIEHRELTAYAPPGPAIGAPAGMLLEFASRVRPAQGEVKLDGDPQHAGFHFRASNEVSQRAAKIKREKIHSDEQAYFIRPDGVGRPGEDRNWDATSAAGLAQVNFPWKGMSFVVAGRRYTVANLDQPTNPREARFSERDYGRFGSYFEYVLTPEHPLEVDYRIWIQAGEMQPAEIAALDADFVHPIEVVLTAK